MKNELVKYLLIHLQLSEELEKIIVESNQIENKKILAEFEGMKILPSGDQINTD